MAPPVQPFHVSELPTKIQYDEKGKGRKPIGSSPSSSSTSSSPSSAWPPVRLEACDKFSLTQYQCHVNPLEPNGPVRCYAVEKFFRKCRDASKSFTVETTAWERQHKNTVQS